MASLARKIATEDEDSAGQFAKFPIAMTIQARTQARRRIPRGGERRECYGYRIGRVHQYHPVGVNASSGARR
jgi:hypothetical protein